MPTMFDDVDAKRPYYLSSGKRKIVCEGITEDCLNTTTNFKSQEKKCLHRKIFCDDKYKYCEIYNMLEKKYEE